MVVISAWFLIVADRKDKDIFMNNMPYLGFDISVRYESRPTYSKLYILNGLFFVINTFLGVQ